MKPIIKFKNKQQVNACLQYWKTRLMLTDWDIRVVVCDLQNYAGQVEYDTVIKVAYIQIQDEHIKDSLEVLVHEHILVHELLHLTFSLIYDKKNQTQLRTVLLHQNIEQLAKSFIIIKYNLSPDWFIQINKGGNK